MQWGLYIPDAEYVTIILPNGLTLKNKKCYCENGFFMLILRLNGKDCDTHR